jgi:hypothetical protein
MEDGIVTHLERTAVDPALAAEQHARYVDALAGAGWEIREAPRADELPDSAFIEDTMVVCDGVSVLARPGAAERRAEVEGAEAAVRELGLGVARIEAPGTLDGGDVLQVGDTVYVGRGGRTNGEGIRRGGRRRRRVRAHGGLRDLPVRTCGVAGERQRLALRGGTEGGGLRIAEAGTPTGPVSRVAGAGGVAR